MSIGGDEFTVQLYGFHDHFLEQLYRGLGHENAAACALQPLGIFAHAEYPDFAILAAVCLEPFESFLPVVQACGSHVNVNRGF